jgi:Flp pilus assembly CpaE family ATPase
MATPIDAGELVSLFDLLATRYDFVVADCSGRVDEVSRAACYASAAVLLVVEPSLAAMFSGRRIHDFLVWEIGADRVQFVLNRCRRGVFSDPEIRNALNGEIVWKIADGSEFVDECVERGTPVVLQKKNEVARAIRALASTLAHTDTRHREAEANHHAEEEAVLPK